MNNLILEKLTIIEELLFEKKKVLNPVELSKYTGYSKATIYKMVQNNIIPYSKPNGKHLFVDREKIDEWLLTNTSKDSSQLKKEARDFVNRNRKYN